MKDKNKYWIHHAGSDSYFAAIDVNEAVELTHEFNKIAVEYGRPPLNKICIVNDSDLPDYIMELENRQKMGDEEYFNP